jgi:hypothetical protein
MTLRYRGGMLPSAPTSSQPATYRPDIQEKDDAPLRHLSRYRLSHF